MENFNQITGHLYKVKNQNGLNAALYEYFSATDNGNNSTRSKKEVRDMVQNHPPYYPIAMVIKDAYDFLHDEDVSFEVKLETVCDHYLTK